MNIAPTPDPDLKIDHAPPTLRALAVDRIRSAIISGRFAGGARLVERSLCDQLGVSRSIVREAIRYLEAEGLVEVQPRSGPIVARLDWPRAAQIYAIRRVLEAEAAADCARAADDGVKTQLRAALLGLETAIAGGAPDGAIGATHGFYQIIFLSAGHEIAWEMVQRLNGRISRLRVLTLASDARRISGPAHMARICDAICANDPRAAANAVQNHMTEASEIARKLLQASTTETAP